MAERSEQGAGSSSAPTTCYVAYCNDRYIDPEVAVFMDFDSAIIWASDWMEEHVAHPGNLREP